MARFSAETVRLAKQELDESLARMQQTARQLARRGEHAERSARAEQTAAGEKCRQMQQQLDQVKSRAVCGSCTGKTGRGVWRKRGYHI